MSTPTESFFIRSGRLKRLIAGAKQLRSYADSTGNSQLLSEASVVQGLLIEGDYYVGIPDESYPTMYHGKDLNLEGMDDGVTIRAQLKSGDLGRVLAMATQVAKRLRDSGDEKAETADLVVAILTVMKAEEYQGKTHQVASFDPMGERLGFLP